MENENQNVMSSDNLLPSIETQKHDMSLDLLRIIGMFMVVMLHVSSQFLYFTDEAFMIGNIFDGAVRVGVPIFVMISGALMLDERKNVTIKRLITKNVLHMLLLFVCWSFFYTLMYHMVPVMAEGGEINHMQNYETFVRGHWHMWYLYMIMGLYLLTPILRCIAKKSNAKIVGYFILLNIIFSAIQPILQMISWKSQFFNIVRMFFGQFQTNILYGYTVYYLLGWYLVHVGIDKKWNIPIYVAGALSVIAIICITNYNRDGLEVTYNNTSILNMLYATAIFIFVRGHYKGGERSDKVVHFFARLSFGVYMIHLFMMDAMIWALPSFGGHWFGWLIALYLLTVVLSLAFSWVVSYIPGVKKLIRC